MNIKKCLPISLAILLGAGLAGVQAQPGMRGGPMMGGAPHGPNLGGSMAKILGDNSAFSADLEMQVKPASGEAVQMPGKLYADAGKSRFEVDMTKMKSSTTRPQAAAQMKAMGMDTTVMISRPDKQTSYQVYTGLNAYLENPMATADDTATVAAKYKIEKTELGKETLDGHPCVKSKVVVTDDKGQKHESLVWTATDLNNFPIKVEQDEQGSATTMMFKNVKVGKPDAALFDLPAGATKYDSMPAMMQDVMMKRYGGRPPGRPPGQ